VSPALDTPERRSRLLVGGAVLAAALLVAAYLAAGGASYEPTPVQDPCKPREWRNPAGLQAIAEQFSLSALDGAACELRVPRETLAAALTTPERRDRFARRYGIGDAQLEAAVRAGVLRAIDDAERAGALSPIVAVPLREAARHLPVEQAIELIRDARPVFDQAFEILGGISSMFGQAQGLLP
jgi:hypothetical protein